MSSLGPIDVWQKGRADFSRPGNRSASGLQRGDRGFIDYEVRKLILMAYERAKVHSHRESRMP
jgi:hypothetical protein